MEMGRNVAAKLNDDSGTGAAVVWEERDRLWAGRDGSGAIRLRVVVRGQGGHIVAKLLPEFHIDPKFYILSKNFTYFYVTVFYSIRLRHFVVGPMVKVT